MILDVLFNALTFSSVFFNPLTEKIKMRYTVPFSIFIMVLCFFQYDFFFLTFIGIASYILFIAFITKNKLINCVSALFCYMLSVVSNNLMLVFLQACFHIDVQYLFQHPAPRICFYIVYFILMFLMSYSIGIYMKKHFAAGIHKQYKKTIVLVLLELVLCSVVLCFNIEFGQLYDYSPKAIFFNCILFFIYFLMSTLLLLHVVRVIRQNILMEQKEAEDALLKSYMDNLEQNAGKLRKFKHDYLNILITLDELIHTDPLRPGIRFKRNR